MVAVRYGGKNGSTYDLTISDAHIAVRTFERKSIVSSIPAEAVQLSVPARQALREFDLTWRVAAAGVEVLATSAPAAAARRDGARALLKQEDSVRFAGRVLIDPNSGQPVLYTENLFVKFDGDEDAARCEAIIRDYKLEIKRPVTYARNGYFVGAPEGTGLEVFDIAEQLLKLPEVELCHPELIREARARQAFAPQWHLAKTTISGKTIDAHANVTAAWTLANGEGITIAVIDDGVDIDHDEFRASGKVVAPRDVTMQSNDPRPGSGDRHGTACAGVACADGNHGASGVAPRAKLMPIRLASDLGSQAEADSFAWAAQNGADVISCSWGPVDGDWTNPNDPRHHAVVPLPDSTKQAIDFAVNNGRNGKGCVILFAAGNGNESVDNDGYASYAKVIAVAACNDSGRKSAYSDFGDAIWTSFPSGDGVPSQTTGIWTTDVSGKRGYNSGVAAKGDLAGHYTNSFNGTSSACPGAAGVAALILSRNPALRWNEVKDIMRQASVPIDVANGAYDAQGHSKKYGYGRIDAKKAVDLAVPIAPKKSVVRSVRPDAAILDHQRIEAILDVPDAQPVLRIKAKVDIEHTYVGDLKVTLQPPPGVGAQPILLHVREGGSTDNLRRTYDAASTPALQGLTGKAAQGQWTLAIEDEAAQDEGVLRAFELEFEF